MLKRILVPLDGSGFGEQALPTAQRIAERERAEIVGPHLGIVHAAEAVQRDSQSPDSAPNVESPDSDRCRAGELR